MVGHNLYMHTKFQDLEVLRKFDQYNSALLNQPYIVYTALLEKTTHTTTELKMVMNQMRSEETSLKEYSVQQRSHVLGLILQCI